MTESPYPDISAASRALTTGEISSVELVDLCLDRIARHDGELDAMVAVYADEARAAAGEADRERRSGAEVGELHGIPVAVKDVIATREGPTRGGSAAWSDEWHRSDAESVSRLRRAGAVIVGKTRTLEFAAGLPDRVVAPAATANPWSPDRWAGGSSSGSAAGVSAGFFYVGLGTDSGGSIRCPAAYCGVTGLKPTFGLVPTEGMIPWSWSLDHIGPLTRTARDSAVAMSALTGRRRSVAPNSLAGLRVGVVREGHLDGSRVAPELPGLFDDAVAVLEALGAEVIEAVLPWNDAAVQASMIITPADGFSAHRANLADRWERYGTHTRTQIALGAMVSATDYAIAQRAATAARAALAALFEDVDILVAPTASTPAVLIDDLFGVDLRELIGTTIFVPYWDVVGVPTVSIPIGFSADGLPFGMQVAAGWGRDEQVLGVAEAFQLHTEWVRQPHLRESIHEAAA